MRFPEHKTFTLLVYCFAFTLRLKHPDYAYWSSRWPEIRENGFTIARFTS